MVEAETPLDRAVACAHYPVLEEVDEEDPLVRLSHRLFGRNFRPEHAGGRSMAFSRAAWEEVGGFPEHVYAGEDLAFSAAAIDRGFRPTLVEEAAVSLAPPDHLARDNARMFATYTRGDIRTKGRGRHLARLAAWSAGPALVVGAASPDGCWSPPARRPTCGSRCAERGGPCQRASGGGSRPGGAEGSLSAVGSGSGSGRRVRGVPQPPPHRWAPIAEE